MKLRGGVVIDGRNWE